MEHLTVGVLALQGAVSEHLQQLQGLGVKAVAVKNINTLAEINALILPGGESTAIGNLMRRNGFIEAIQHFAQQGKPIFGTCAGMILLAKELEDGEQPHLQLMDISVRRNAFGRQVDSFQTDLTVKGLNLPFPAVFIRAPYITKIISNQVEILAEFEGNPVLAKQGNILACSFHPELTLNKEIIQLFLAMIRQ